MEHLTQLPPEMARAQAYIQRLYNLGERRGLRANDPKAQATLGAVNEYNIADLLIVLRGIYTRAPHEIGPLIQDENTLIGAIAKIIGFSV